MGSVPPRIATSVKKNLKMLKTIYKGACGLKRGSKETRMSVSEWNTLVKKLGLFDEDFTKREARPACDSSRRAG